MSPKMYLCKVHGICEYYMIWLNIWLNLGSWEEELILNYLVGSESNHMHSYKTQGGGDTWKIHRGEDHVKKEAESGVTKP